MPAAEKIDYSALDVGFRFPPLKFTITEDICSAYMQVIGEDNKLYRQTNLVPPMSVLALAMAEMSKNISFPEGAILVSQTLEFYHPVRLNDILTAAAEVVEKLQSKRLSLLTIKLRLFNQHNDEVASAETCFALGYRQKS